MVVAPRKSSISAPPPVSRSNSSQALPRAVKGKAPLGRLGASVTRPSPPAPGNSQTRKLSAKKKQKHTVSPASFTSTRLFLLLLSVFTIYATSTCRYSTSSDSPICNALDAYRTQVLDPYIVPSLQSLYTRASPHLTPLQPYAASTLAFTDAYITQHVSATLSTAKIVYETHIHPRLHWFFIEQYWNGIIKPMYFKGPHPYLEAQTRPFRIYYHRTAVPHARNAIKQLKGAYVRARPLADPYIDLAKYRTSHAYELVRYHGLDAWAHVQPRIAVVLEDTRVRAEELAGRVADTRRAYVDPHLRRIWEKIMERTGTEGGSSPATKETATAEGSEQQRTNEKEKEKGEEPVPTRTRDPASHDGGTQGAFVLDTDADAFSSVLESAHAISRRLASGSASSYPSSPSSSSSTIASSASPAIFKDSPVPPKRKHEGTP